MREEATFTGRVVRGSGRGKTIGTPTINIDPNNAPREMTHGVYACFITLDGNRHMGALHFGPRPVFKDSLSLEVHILDGVIAEVPETVTVEVIGKIREIQDFASPKLLLERIGKDIEAARAMLSDA